jgi:hypothetical protein
MKTSKTFWGAIAAIVGMTGAVFTGEVDAGTAIRTGVDALLMIFLRDAIADK